MNRTVILKYSLALVPRTRSEPEKKIAVRWFAQEQEHMTKQRGDKTAQGHNITTAKENSDEIAPHKTEEREDSTET